MQIIFITKPVWKSFLRILYSTSNKQKMNKKKTKKGLANALRSLCWTQISKCGMPTKPTAAMQF